MKMTLSQVVSCFFLLIFHTAIAACPVSLNASYEACEGEILVLDSNGDSSFIYQWFFNGTLIAGADGATLLVNEAGDYEVNATNGTTNCDASTTVVLNPIPNEPDSNFLDILEICDDDMDGFGQFDLTVQDAAIIGTQDPADFLPITYYVSQVDAESGANPIVSPENFIATNQTVWSRLESGGAGCFRISNFDLLVLPLPSPATPTPLEVCDVDGDGFAEFDLTNKDVEIINGEENVVVTYHPTLVDATINVNALSSPHTNVVAFSEIVYARVENILSSCAMVVELELLVLVDCPVIDEMPTNLFLNEGDNDGLAIFDLTVNETQMLGAQDASVYLFTYHTTLNDSANGVNPIATPMSYQNIANPQTIYVRLTNSNNSSFTLASFEIETDGILAVDQQATKSFSVYPNPTQNMLFISSTDTFDGMKVVLYDLNGRVLSINNLNVMSSQFSIDVSRLSPGVYFVEIESEGKKMGKKMIKN